MTVRVTLIVIHICIICSIISLTFARPPIPGIGNSQRLSGFIAGDFIIGALFSIHERPLLGNNTDPLKCGEVRENYGIQRVEAAFFAMDNIQKNKELLPGLNLGIHIKDGCWSESIVLHQAIDLIEYPADPNEDSDQYDDSMMCSQSPNRTAPLIGLIGPASSATTIPVQNLLKLFRIPEVGYAATSVDLTNNNLYPYFLRVVPSDFFQAKLMWTMLKKFGWTYISVVYNDDNYGQSFTTVFRRHVSDYDICVSKYKSIVATAPVDVYNTLIAELDEETRVNVIVCFCDGITVMNIMGSIKKANLTGRFTFIGSDSWGSRYSLVDGFETQVHGVLTIGIDEKRVPEFDEYYLSLNPTNNKRNPWFREFWQLRFNCTFNTSASSGVRLCTGNEDLSVDYDPDSKIDYVIKALYSMAYALHSMQSDLCNSSEPMCPKFARDFDTELFMNYVTKVNFTYRNEMWHFDENGEPWKVKYNIYNFQKKSENDYDYIPVGEYVKQGSEEYLRFYNESSIQFVGDVIPKSVCSDACPIGSAQIISNESEDQKCCWTCLDCKTDEIVNDGSSCVACYEGYWPNANRTLCVQTSMKYFLVGYSITGMVLTILAIVVFIKFQHTPVVKSSTRELSYMMLFGMMITHSTSIVMVIEQTALSCAILRTTPSLGFTIIYASLFIKTNRIARLLAISKKKFPNMRPKFISLTAQITATFILIGMQMTICAVMLVKEVPNLTENYQEKLGAMFCPLEVAAILPPFGFVAFLIFMCTVYAVKTRNLPDNFNEAKFIGFAMYVTCITWLAFALIYFGSALKVTIVCICASTNALVILAFLFFPKMYIIIFKPERNTRANFTTTKGIRCFITGSSGTQPSSVSYSTNNSETSSSRRLIFRKRERDPL